MVDFVIEKWIEIIFAGIFILYVVFLWRVSQAELNRDMKIYRNVYNKNKRNETESETINNLKK